MKRHRRPAAADITADTLLWCPGCSAERTAREFNVESRRFSGRAGRCRQCQARARRTEQGIAATRRRNRRRWADPEYRAKSLEWHRQRRERLGANHDLRRARQRLQRIVDEWKRTGCIDCGFDDIRAIDPDHVRGEKSGNVSRLVQMCVAADRLRAELDGCEPRCANCHRVRTYLDRVSSWRTLTKIPPSWRERLDLQDRNDAIKLARGCTDCGYAQHARALDWDHVGDGKTAGISTMIANRRPWHEIIAEMKVCQVRCANCHRIRTYERRARSHPATPPPGPASAGS